MFTDFLCGSKTNSVLGEPCNEKGGVRPMLCVFFTCECQPWGFSFVFTVFPALLSCSVHVVIPTELSSIYKGAIGTLDYVIVTPHGRSTIKSRKSKNLDSDNSGIKNCGQFCLVSLFSYRGKLLFS